VLVLSEFAGAAQALGAGALLVNPYNTDEVASALHDALNMKMEEREQRFDYMSTHINQHTAQTWAEKFVGSLRHARETSNYDSGPFSNLEEPSALPQRDVVASYKQCERSGGRRLLIFGLLGTLIDYSHFASLDQLLPSVRRNLAELAASPNNTVIVCSGRERALMNEWLGDLPIWLVAENGLFVRPPVDVHAVDTGAADAWEPLKDDPDDSWMASLKPVFKYFEARTPDAFTEVQEYTMTWHYQAAANAESLDEEFAEVQAGDLQAHLVKVSGHAPVEVSLDMKRVEVRPYGVSKGAAIQTILERLGASKDTALGPTAPAAESPLPPPAGPPSSETALVAAVTAGAAEHLPPLLPLQPPGTVTAAVVGGGTSFDARTLTSPACGSAGSQALHVALAERENDVESGRAPIVEAAVAPAPTEPPFRWVFCASEVISRDEDLFSNLQALGEDADAGARVFTCCVGKTLSQADYHLADSNEVAGLLDLLAHASVDQRDSAVAASVLNSPNEAATPQSSDLPSTLERLHQLVRLLAGKSLLLIFDFDGCKAASLHPSRDMARFLQLYPAAVVQRNPITAPDALAAAEAASAETRYSSTARDDSPTLGAISGVQVVSYGRPGHAPAAASTAFAPAPASAPPGAHCEREPSTSCQTGGAHSGGGSAWLDGGNLGSLSGCGGAGAGLFSSVAGGSMGRPTRPPGGFAPHPHRPCASCDCGSSDGGGDGGSSGSGSGSAARSTTVVHQVIDSYRPALESCLAQLQTQLEGVPQVTIEDNTFSLTVTHRGASETQAAEARATVSKLVGDEYPMLRSIEERTEVLIRPEAGWNKARMVEWIVSQVVEAVEAQLGHRGVMPIYLGEDPAFRHISAIGGLDILLTGGPATDSYFLRSAMQVDELLRWFAEQHAAGVTVRGGKLRPPKAASIQPPHKAKPGSAANDGRIPRAHAASERSSSGKERRRVQIFPAGGAEYVFESHQPTVESAAPNSRKATKAT